MAFVRLVVIAVLVCGCGELARVDLGPSAPPHAKPFSPPAPVEETEELAGGVVGSAVSAPLQLSREWSHDRAIAVAARSGALVFANQQISALRTQASNRVDMFDVLELVSHDPLTGAAIGGRSWHARDGNGPGSFDAWLVGDDRGLFIAANVRGVSDLLPGLTDAAVVVGLSPGGTDLWTHRLNGASQVDPAWTGLRIVGIAVHPDGGVVVAAAKGTGGSFSIDPNAPGVLIRIDETGVERWRTGIPSARSVSAVAIDETGRIYVGGNETGASYLAAFQMNGPIDWLRTLANGVAVRGLAVTPSAVVASISISGVGNSLQWTDKVMTGGNNPSTHALIAADRQGQPLSDEVTPGSGFLTTDSEGRVLLRAAISVTGQSSTVLSVWVCRYAPESDVLERHSLAVSVEQGTYEVGGVLALDGSVVVAGTRNEGYLYPSSAWRNAQWFLQRFGFEAP